MFGVCFRCENRPWIQDQWSWVFSNFGVSEIWERGTVAGDAKIYQPVTEIETAASLPNRPLVVLAHPEGRYVKGTESLVDFVHPDDAIYLFGASMANLSDEDDLGGRVPDHTIFIPSVEYEMYSFAAGYLTLYDRFVKRGDFG